MKLMRWLVAVALIVGLGVVLEAQVRLRFVLPPQAGGGGTESAVFQPPCDKAGTIDFSGGTNGNTVTTGTLMTGTHNLTGNYSWSIGTGGAPNSTLTYATKSSPVYGTMYPCSGASPYADASSVSFRLSSVGGNSGNKWAEFNFPSNVGTITEVYAGTWISTNIPGATGTNKDLFTIFTDTKFNNVIMTNSGGNQVIRCEYSGVSCTLSDNNAIIPSNQTRVWFTIGIKTTAPARLDGAVYAEDPNRPGAIGERLVYWNACASGCLDGAQSGFGNFVYLTMGDLIQQSADSGFVDFDSVKVCYLSGCAFPVMPDYYPWSGLITRPRAIDWAPNSTTGFGTIPTNRTTCVTAACNTVTSAGTGATAAQINSAILSAPSNTAVTLGAGTYTMTAMVNFTGANNNVTLKGAGANATFLVWTNGAHAGCTLDSNICISNPQRDPSPANTANWTAGYEPGDTTISISARTAGATNISVGTLLHLDQNSDGTTDTNDIWVCSTSTTCTVAGSADPQRSQVESVIVTAITNGGACPCVATISPGLHMPNWRSAKSPRVWWSSQLPLTGAGLEDISVDFSADTSGYWGIAVFNATGWIQRARIILAKSKDIYFYNSINFTFRDSYMFGVQRSNVGPDAYGVGVTNSSNILIENNILQALTQPVMDEGSCGLVMGYNYAINQKNTADADFAVGTYQTHATSGFICYPLIEGNDGLGLEVENQYGQTNFIANFRNRWMGREQDGRTLQTVPIMDYARMRHNNHIGNVLGLSGYHNRYESIAGAVPSLSVCNHSIFALGIGGDCQTGGGGTGYPSDNAYTTTSSMRWGNWDIVNNASRFLSAEVPSGLTLYKNLVPGSQTLPASLYLNAKPSFFGSQQWPPFGPDLTAGTLPNTGNHAYKLPARLCFENIMGGTFGDTTAKAFNPSACYPAP